MIKVVNPHCQLLDGNTEVCWSEVNDDDIKSNLGNWNEEDDGGEDLFTIIVHPIWEEKQ